MQLDEIVLGGMLLDNDKINLVEEIIYPEHFQQMNHMKLYNKILQLHRNEKPVDVFIISELMGDRWLTIAGDMVSLAARYGSTVEHAKLIRDRFISSNLHQQLCKSISQLNEKTNYHDVINDLNSHLSSLSQQEQGGLKRIGENMDEFVDDMEKNYHNKCEIIGLSTGLTDLDKSIHGMQDGNLIIIAGRPAMGKSVLAMNIASHNALAGKNVLFFSLEMTEPEIKQRLISSISQTDYAALQSSQCVDNHDDMAMISEAIGKVKVMPFYVDDASMLSIESMKSRSISYEKKHGSVDLVVVDYLQLLSAKAENRLQEVSIISRELKALAKKLNCPVIALSQLNRGLESRSDKRPLTSDLRESGQLEQDADKILFIYRDEVYNPHSSCKGLAEIIIGKARSCKGDDVVTVFDGSTQTFKNATHFDFEQVDKLKQPVSKHNNFTKRYQGNF